MTESGEIVVQKDIDQTVEVIILIPRDSDSDAEWLQESIAKFLIIHLEQEFISHGREPMKVALVFAAKNPPYYLKRSHIYQKEQGYMGESVAKPTRRGG